MIVQVISALIGSIGFAVFFNMKRKQIYLLCQQQIEGYFVPYFIASIFVAVYAEIMARMNRAPATIFLTAAAVPLIPGGSLYYTMAGLVNGDQALFAESGASAVTIALAISLGFVVVAIITKYITGITSRRK